MFDMSSGRAVAVHHCYNLYDVPLVPQDMNMACWYASAMMLYLWWQKQFRYWEDRNRATYRSELLKVNNPSELPEEIRMHFADNGLSASGMVKLARALGLKPVPPTTPTPTCGPVDAPYLRADLDSWRD